ncbi:MAG: glycosyltransferase family 2 protein [Clostridia bacterium]|nr:glycosyltransferase family 2 protein [Clostridia bacterium]
MNLSICVITMNRARQLSEALHSCLACELPTNTEFVIIDNASTDDTESVVRTVLGDCGYPYYYERLAENAGVGGGRNYAYEKATGDVAYMLDDDAVIDVEHNSDFFLHALDMLEKHPSVVTLTTQIYDTAWKKNRVEVGGPKITEGLYKCQMFCGGSHFLRKSFFTSAPYLPNKYGYEEIPPSLRAMNAKKINAFCPELLIIHQPANNKWDWSEEKNRQLLFNGMGYPYAIKKMMYPVIARPLLKLANKRRMKIYLSDIENADQKVKEAADNFCRDYPISEKIKFTTLLRMFLDFKLSVF